MRQSRSDSEAPGRLKSSRLRTARVVERASSTESGQPSSGAIPLGLEPVAHRVVAFEPVEWQLAAGPLGILRHLDGVEQQLDLVHGQADQAVSRLLLVGPVD